MPYLPFGGRKHAFDESLIDKKLICKQVTIETIDKCKLAGIILRAKTTEERLVRVDAGYDPVMIYFQG